MTDVRPWAPARPAGTDRSALRPPGAAPWSPPPGAGSQDRGDAPSTDRVAAPGRLRRLTSGRRVVAAYLALATVIALVASVGAFAQPHYGSLSPYGGDAVDELRSAPVAAGWSADLSTRLAPSLKHGCLNVTAGEVDSGHEFVTPQLPSVGPNGENAGCESAAVSETGRVMMIDPATGRTLWRRDLAATVGTAVFSMVWHEAPSLHAVLVGVDGARRSELVMLDVRTGTVIDRTVVSSSDAAIDFSVTGRLVLSAEPNQGGELTTYQLRRADDLARVLWRQQVSSSTEAELLPDRLLVPLTTGTLSVDGRTGHVSKWATDLRGYEGVSVVGDGLIGVTIPQGVGLGSFVVRLDARGRSMWEVPALAVTGLSASRSCILMSSVTSKLVCIVPSTGRFRWVTTSTGLAEGTPNGARTADVEIVRGVRSQDTTQSISQLDGPTGRTRFTTVLPRGSVVVGESTGTGYAVDSSAGADDVLTAFDVATGRVLWTYRARSIQLWGGHFVAVGGDGVTRELVEPHGAVGTLARGTTGSGRVMLVE